VEILVGAVIVWIIPIFVAHSIGRSKRRHGFWYGFLLGWIGVLIVALLPARPEETLAEQLEFIERNPYGHSKEKVEAARAEVLAKLAAASRDCPFCKEQMRRDASVCPHCRHESEAWTFHDGAWWLSRNGVWNRHDESTGEWVPVDPAQSGAT
jgi:hypothetical protein